jgi:SdpC family antimicrobial peptide
MTQTFKIPVTAALIISIALLGVRSSAFAKAKARSFTGEDVYRGLVWGEGPVSKLLPEVWSMDAVAAHSDTKEKMMAWNDAKEHVVAKIKAKDPTFMSRFGEEMQSGDHLRVQAAMSEASTNTVQTLSEMGYVDEDGNAVPDISLVRIILAVYIAVAVAVLWVQLYFPNSPAPGDESALRQETLTNNLTERLAAD